MLDDEIKELLTNESFVNWVKSEDASKNQYWVDWLSRNPGKKKAFHQAQQLIRSMKYEDDYQMNPDDYDGLYYDLLNSFHQSGAKRSTTRYWISGVAASLLLLCGLVGYFWLNNNAKEAGYQAYETIEKSTPNGTKLTVSLPDGSMVKLNSGSKLLFQTPFGLNGTREISLVGEAYFEVTEDESKPFIVKTTGVETTVLGTTFNVSAYEEDNQVNVALVTGMVKVNVNHASQKTEKILSPSEMMTFSRKDRQVTVKNFEVDQVIGWKDQIIHFEKESLPRIIDRLERWYGVDIKVNNPNDRIWNYTGRFEKKSLELVLLRMAYTEEFTYKIENNKVIINIK